MYLGSDSLDQDVRLTVEAATDVTNAALSGASPLEIKAILAQHEFHSVDAASDIEVIETHRTVHWLAGLVDSLPEAELVDAVASVNRALASRAVTPSISDHNPDSLHIHWTAPQVPLAGRVAVDVLMALAQTLCEYGIDRFGRCSADDCSAVFYDATKNRSRRFCSDPRCASRTHTANHRARKNNS